MDDEQIVNLYWERSEAAISATEEKYGRYCYSIASHILWNAEDSEECVSDTYMRAWNSMPPHRPAMLKTFLGKLARNLALDRYERIHAGKRNRGQTPMVYEELQECLPAPDGTEHIVEDMALTELLNRFLGGLPPEQRKIFMQRYWYFRSIREISEEYDVSESKVKMSLLRTRNKLKEVLEKEWN